jgi:hypothetical protein
MSDVSPDFSILSRKAPFNVLLLFHEASQARSIPSTGPSANDALKDLVGLKVNGSMIASRMWGEVYNSTKIEIPPGLQIVGWIYRSPPNRRKKALFWCRGWPWGTFASDEDRELDKAVLNYQLEVGSAAASDLSLDTMIDTVKGLGADDEASKAWTGLMKRYFDDLQAREVTEEAPSDVASLSRVPTTCPTCGSQTGYQDASTQTEQDPIWPYGLPAIFAKPGSEVGTSQPDSDLWTNQQLENFINEKFDSSSQAKRQ